MSSAFHLGHVMAATDESDAGRAAVSAALRLASRAGGRATIARVLPFDGSVSRGAMEQLQRWVESALPALEASPPMEYAIAYGVPGIEIGRIGERIRADLLVLGRKPRSRALRLLLGDTGDAVARRSRIPCLFVPPSETLPRRILAAVDGSPRGTTVLRVAGDFAGRLGAGLGVRTGERAHAGEPPELAVAMPATLSARMEAGLDPGLARGLQVRRGEAADQILAAVEEDGPDVLVIGCHRGGPAGVIEAGSTARQVIHRAPCAVLTVPL
jgi:nucleotide-binding universal stress UspA family protein